jgi:hypothetical protein
MKVQTDVKGGLLGIVAIVGINLNLFGGCCYNPCAPKRVC